MLDQKLMESRIDLQIGATYGNGKEEIVIA